MISNQIKACALFLSKWFRKVSVPIGRVTVRGQVRNAIFAPFFI